MRRLLECQGKEKSCDLPIRTNESGHLVCAIFVARAAARLIIYFLLLSAHIPYSVSREFVCTENSSFGVHLSAKKLQEGTTMRILLAAILGGIAMFAWSSIAHMALPLGETGVRQIPVESEPAVLNAMQTGLSASPGFYIFPGMGHDQKAMQEYDKKLAAAPSGVLIYHPAGASLDMPRHLGVEFFTEFLETFLVIMLLNQTRITSYVARVGFVTLAGILASITA